MFPHKIIEDHIWAELKPSVKAVYTVLWKHVYCPKGKIPARPEVRLLRKTIARESGINRVETIRLAVRDLEQRGLVERIATGRSNIYVLTNPGAAQQLTFADLGKTRARSDPPKSARSDPPKSARSTEIPLSVSSFWNRGTPSYPADVAAALRRVPPDRRNDLVARAGQALVARRKIQEQCLNHLQMQRLAAFMDQAATMTWEELADLQTSRQSGLRRDAARYFGRLVLYEAQTAESMTG